MVDQTLRALAVSLGEWVGDTSGKRSDQAPTRYPEPLHRQFKAFAQALGQYGERAYAYSPPQELLDCEKVADAIIEMEELFARPAAQ